METEYILFLVASLACLALIFAGSKLLQRIAHVKTIRSGIMPIGKYKGHRIETLPREYVAYWLVRPRNKVVEALRLQFIAVHPDLSAIPACNRQRLGKAKEKIQFTGTVTQVREITKYGRPIKLREFITDEGEILVYRGEGKSLDEIHIGQRLAVSARVKKHGKWGGLPETEISGPKIKAE